MLYRICNLISYVVTYCGFHLFSTLKILLQLTIAVTVAAVEFSFYDPLEIWFAFLYN